MAAYRDKEDLIAIGAYQPGSDPLTDRAIAAREEIQAFLKQGASDVGHRLRRPAAARARLDGGPGRGGDVRRRRGRRRGRLPDEPDTPCVRARCRRSGWPCREPPSLRVPPRAGPRAARAGRGRGQGAARRRHGRTRPLGPATRRGGRPSARGPLRQRGLSARSATCSPIRPSSSAASASTPPPSSTSRVRTPRSTRAAPRCRPPRRSAASSSSSRRSRRPSIAAPPTAVRTRSSTSSRSQASPAGARHERRGHRRPDRRDPGQDPGAAGLPRPGRPRRVRRGDGHRVRGARGRRRHGRARRDRRRCRRRHRARPLLRRDRRGRRAPRGRPGAAQGAHQAGVGLRPEREVARGRLRPDAAHARDRRLARRHQPARPQAGDRGRRQVPQAAARPLRRRPEKALAAYNAGPGRGAEVRRRPAVRGDQNYVKKVIGYAEAFRAQGAVASSPAPSAAAMGSPLGAPAPTAVASSPSQFGIV
jgi:hypothetical protein